MNAAEKAYVEDLLQQVKHYRGKHQNAVEGGIRTQIKHISRLNRRIDLDDTYIFAAEALFNQIGLDQKENELEPAVRLALSSFNMARADLGLIRKEHTKEDCGGRCKLHREPATSLPVEEIVSNTEIDKV